MTQLPAGWYPDQQFVAIERWWDGSKWTTATRPAIPPRPSPVSSTPYANQSSGARGMALSAGLVALVSVLLGVPFPGLGGLGGTLALVLGLVALWNAGGSLFVKGWSITAIAMAPIATILSAPFPNVGQSVLGLVGVAALTWGVLAVAKPRGPKLARPFGVAGIILGSLTVLGAGALYIVTTDSFRAGWISSDVDVIEKRITDRLNEQAARDRAPWRANETVCYGVTSLADGSRWPCTTFFDDGDEIDVVLTIDDGVWDWYIE